MISFSSRKQPEQKTKQVFWMDGSFGETKGFFSIKEFESSNWIQPFVDVSGQIIATSAEVTLNCGLVKESAQKIPLIQVQELY